LEFIPYDYFEDIKYIAEGGFREVSKATWIDGIRNAKKIDNRTWIKTCSDHVTLH